MDESRSFQAVKSRHCTPGSLLIIAIALYVFIPKAWDTIMGEPWINNTLEVAVSATGNVIVEDSINTRAAVHGSRLVYIEDASEVSCAREYHGLWDGQSKRFWRFNVLTGCEAPKGDFKVCTSFALTSDASGRKKLMGPFCTDKVQLPV